ncbi:MAG: TipAS antibiotic-recognition domain-containing protein [Rubrobacter sp.]|nr:TipAS antibiotic-recognition domain-containing protein [Rubrobacter sp.]
MEAQTIGIRLTPEERFEVFGDFHPEDYGEEAEQRWGGTKAYRQSQHRVASYTKEDWQQIKYEEEEVHANLAAALAAGSAPDSDEALAAAEAHRQYITCWFYDCSYDIHRGLTDMYLNEERFRAHYDALVPGLALFIREAAYANANLAGTDC